MEEGGEKSVISEPLHLPPFGKGRIYQFEVDLPSKCGIPYGAHSHSNKTGILDGSLMAFTEYPVSAQYVGRVGIIKSLILK